jgi:uncharacterized protein (TIGR02217 family)
MSFIETPRFPNNIAYGALVGPEYRTEIAELYSGFEQRNVVWDQPRLRFEIEMPLSNDQLAELDAWFRAVKGQGHGFRVRDPRDYRTVAADGRLGASDSGTGVPTYQLSKKYAAGSLTEYRNLRKPMSTPTPQIYRGGVLQTAGGAPGNYALDTTTGIVTWVASASAAVNAIGIGASTTITLASTIGLAIGGQLYLTGLTGTVSTVLNGFAHQITNIVGNIHTISTSTTGLAYTSGGTGFRYPQSTETLHWIGQFDIPCRFEGDFLGMRAEAPDRWRGNMIMREIRT